MSKTKASAKAFPNQFYLLLSTLVLLGLTLACGFRTADPPTPKPFPVEGVRQLTFDYAHYEGLMWSPKRQAIAAIRCGIFTGKPNCNRFSELVLIDPTNGRISVPDLSSIIDETPEVDTRFWWPDGEEIFFFVFQDVDSSYYTYHIDHGTISKIDSDSRHFASSMDGESVLRLESVVEGTLAVGWSDVDGQNFEEIFQFHIDDYPHGPSALSPDERLFLMGDTSDVSHCQTVYAANLETNEGFKPFLSPACFPAWSPDGSKLAYVLISHDPWSGSKLMVADADGANPRSVFGDEVPQIISYPTWSPDGRQIAFTSAPIFGQTAIYLVDMPPD